MRNSLLFGVLLLQNIAAQAPAAQSPATSSSAAVSSTASSSTALSSAVSPSATVSSATASSSAAATSSTSNAPKGEPIPAPKAGPPPPSTLNVTVSNPGCKVIVGDKEWPADEVWIKEIPGVQKSPSVFGNITRPDWVLNAKGPEDVQAAVNFASKYSIRVSIINSGHDFLGR
jgi:hypothetical protein